MVMTSTKARVETIPGGTATIKMKAHVPNSQAGSSVTINIKSGKGVAQVSACEPPNKKTKQCSGKLVMPIMVLPPWDSAKL